MCTLKGSQQRAKDVLVEIREKEGIPHTLRENRECLEPASSTKEIKFGQGTIKIGVDMNKRICEELKDVMGVYQDIVEHMLNMMPGSCPTKQKFQPLRGERKEAIVEGVIKFKKW